MLYVVKLYAMLQELDQLCFVNDILFEWENFSTAIVIIIFGNALMIQLYKYPRGRGQWSRNIHPTTPS